MADIDVILNAMAVLSAKVDALAAIRNAPTPSHTSIEWLTTPQAAKHLGLSVQRLEIWRSTGGGPKYTKVSRGIVRYQRNQLDAFMEASTRRHTGEDTAATRAVPLRNGKGR